MRVLVFVFYWGQKKFYCPPEWGLGLGLALKQIRFEIETNQEFEIETNQEFEIETNQEFEATLNN